MLADVCMLLYFENGSGKVDPPLFFGGGVSGICNSKMSNVIISFVLCSCLDIKEALYLLQPLWLTRRSRKQLFKNKTSS